MQPREHQRRSISIEEYVRWEFNAVLWICLVGTTWYLLRALFHLLIIRLSSSSSSLFVLATDAGSNNDPQQNLNALLIDLREKYGMIVKLWFASTEILVPVNGIPPIHGILHKVEDKRPMTERSVHISFGPSSLIVLSSDEIRAEVISAQNDSSQEGIKDITNMIPLSKIQETTRLTSAGPLLKPCTLDEGKTSY